MMSNRGHSKLRDNSVTAPARTKFFRPTIILPDVFIAPDIIRGYFESHLNVEKLLKVKRFYDIKCCLFRTVDISQRSPSGYFSGFTEL